MLAGWGFRPLPVEVAPAEPAREPLVDRVLHELADAPATSAEIAGVLQEPQRKCSAVMSRLWREQWLDREVVRYGTFRPSYLYRIKVTGK